jgi:hypothetical protein
MPSANVLPNTLGEVIVRCQGIMGDPTGRVINRGYALPFIQQAYEDIDVALRLASSKNLEAVIEVLGIPAGTSSLLQFQNLGDPTANPPTANGPLAGLYDPLKLWVKSAGNPPQYYSLGRGPRDTLPHVNPPGITPGSALGGSTVTWAWIGNVLQITPVAGAIDMQVYGRFNPPPLVQDTQALVLYPRLTACLAYSSCALMGVERTNPAILEGYAARGEAMTDNIAADLIKQAQANPRRFAKIGGCGGSGWGYGSGRG